MTQFEINVDVFCEGCGKVIVTLKRLLTPTDFKAKYGEACPFCGRDFNDMFKLTDKKRVESYLDDFANENQGGGLNG